MKTDEFGNIVCPKCGQRKYRIQNVSVPSSGIIKFKAFCPLCNKKFKYNKPVKEVGNYEKK
jgi:predicted nucleic-acid-binding Zn-ribbon protein